METFQRSLGYGVALRRGVCGRTARSAGFTLMEMIAVLAIVAILFALVATSVSRSISAARVQGAARDLAAALRFTRSQAIVKREEQVLMFNLNPEQTTYQVPGYDAAREFPEGLEVRVLTADLEVQDSDNAGIRFFPDGSSTGGRVTLISKDDTQIVEVAWLTGQITRRHGGPNDLGSMR